MWIQNQRDRAVEIRSIKLRLLAGGKRYIAYAEAGEQLHAERDIGNSGNRKVGISPAVSNLNAGTSLKLVERGRKSGALQFRYTDLPYDEVNDDELQGASYTLTLVDANDETHHQNGSIGGTLKQLKEIQGRQ